MHPSLEVVPGLRIAVEGAAGGTSTSTATSTGTSTTFHMLNLICTVDRRRVALMPTVEEASAAALQDAKQVSLRPLEHNMCGLLPGQECALAWHAVLHGKPGRHPQCNMRTPPLAKGIDAQAIKCRQQHRCTEKPLTHAMLQTCSAHQRLSRQRRR
jgi:hypothetical protein